MSQSIVTADPTQEKIIDIFAEELEVDASEMTLTGNFVDDYDGDSLALIAVMARIEKELGIVIPKTELVNMVDLQHVFEIVARVESGASGA
jgi:acyl carrier protein